MSFDVLNPIWAFWGALALEGLILLLVPFLRKRTRLSFTLLAISIALNLALGLHVLGSIYTSNGAKAGIAVVLPLINLAWLIWVWRSRGGGHAEPPRPVKQPTQAAREAAPEAPRRPTLRKPSDVAPRPGSPTLDLRPEVKKDQDAKPK